MCFLRDKLFFVDIYCVGGKVYKYEDLGVICYVSKFRILFRI